MVIVHFLHCQQCTRKIKQTEEINQTKFQKICVDCFVISFKVFSEKYSINFAVFFDQCTIVQDVRRFWFVIKTTIYTKSHPKMLSFSFSFSFVAVRRFFRDTRRRRGRKKPFMQQSRNYLNCQFENECGSCFKIKFHCLKAGFFSSEKPITFSFEFFE